MMIWEIGVLVIALAVVVLVGFMVPTLIQLRRSIKKIEDISVDMEKRLPGVMTNVDTITTNLSAILISGRQQAETINSAVTQLKGVVDDVVDVEKNIKHQIDTKLIRSLATFSASVKAAHAFMAVIRDGEVNPQPKPKRRLFGRNKK
ncbi:MAG: DUF948 domain-containing protein [Calditrichia bacterium]